MGHLVRQDRTCEKTIAIGLAALLAFSPVLAPSVALADTPSELQSKLDAANKHLDDLYDQAEVVNEELNGTTLKLEETNTQIKKSEKEIAEQQKELKSAQQSLSKHVSASYKSGSTSLLSILLGSSSWDELSSSIAYANHIAASDASEIEDVRDMQTKLKAKKTDLEKQRDEQQKLQDDQKAKKAELESQTTEAKEYVDSLGDQVQKALEKQRAEEQAEAERQAKKEAERLAEQQSKNKQNNQNNQNGQAEQNNSNKSSNTGQQNQNNNSGSNLNKGGSSSTAGLSAKRQTIVNAALSMIGGTYVYGGYNPAARQFDCSGLTMYCYAQAGISISHYSEAQAQYCTKSISEAQPGDIVWRYGHVGIYIGNGRTVEAHSPAEGIGWGTINRFSRCGSPL